jgi:hypothetical protein
VGDDGGGEIGVVEEEGGSCGCGGRRQGQGSAAVEGEERGGEVESPGSDGEGAAGCGASEGGERGLEGLREGVDIRIILFRLW